MTIEARRNRQLLEAYLWLALSLKRIAANQCWIFPPDALHDERYPRAMVLFSDDKEIGLSPRGERILKSWNRKGLHIRWGMHQHDHYQLYDTGFVDYIANDLREYTTPADFQQQQINRANFMQAVAQFDDSPLDYYTDWANDGDSSSHQQNQNDAYVG